MRPGWTRGLPPLLAIAVVAGAAPRARAGDPFRGFEPLAGPWRAEKCAEPRLEVRLTESRNNAINVYRLDAAGKRTELYFSTAGVLRQSGVLRVSGDEYRDVDHANAIVVQTSEGVLTLAVAAAKPTELRFELRPRKGSPTVCLFHKG